jgi:beta-N-acetylhexosaminidase
MTSSRFRQIILSVVVANVVLLGTLMPQLASGGRDLQTDAVPPPIAPTSSIVERPIATVSTIEPAMTLGSSATLSPSPLATPQRSPEPGLAPVSPMAVKATTLARSVNLFRSDESVVERALQNLATDADRVGQLMLLGWDGDTAAQALPEISDLRAGGIVFVGNAELKDHATAINAGLLQLASSNGVLPPLLAVDHEGGRVQRIIDLPNLGSNRAFAESGADEPRACDRGLRHARELREMGFSMNLAPVLDVNNNPSNPVIGDRSYGADPTVVASLGSAYVRGLQNGGIVAVGKHFPGHGNTAVDSHLQLPIIGQQLVDLEQIELVPFRRSIAPSTAIAAIMTAHIAFPALDPSGAPASLSRAVVTDLLRGRLGFQGLVLTDDLTGMRAITDGYSDGDAAVRAISAGVDMVIMSGGATRQRAARDALLAALDSGQLSRERVAEALRRVVEVKARFGLLDGMPVAPQGCS